MNKKGIFVPTLVIFSIFIILSLNYTLNPMFDNTYKFKFMDVLESEFEVKKQLFDDEQEVKYKVNEALDILFKNYEIVSEEEFRTTFNDIYEGDYEVSFDFINGVKVDVKGNIEYNKDNLKISGKNEFDCEIRFDWDEVKALSSCKNVKSCDELGKCQAKCSEDTKYLNFEYSIGLDFIKSIKFKVEKPGALF